MTFDLWNTLIVEGPGGLFDPRVEHWARVLQAAGLDRERGDLSRAHRLALSEYQSAWRRNEQYGSAEATACVLAAVGVTSCTSSLRAELEATFHQAGLDSDIRATPGAVIVLEDLRLRGIACGLICDIGLTPSSSLEMHLRRLGLAEHLASYTWSDKLGVYKPSPLAFEHALASLEVSPSDAIHVGDRRRTDVAGARAIGMATARYRAIYDDVDELDDADHVIDDLRELLEIVGVP